MNFFIDNNLPPALAHALDALSKREGHHVHAKRDKFPPNTPDVEWLGELAREGDWVILSEDRNILRKPHELAARMESGLTAFFLEKGWSSLNFWTTSAKLVQWWPKIMEQAENVASQVAYRVPVKGAKLTILR